MTIKYTDFNGEKCEETKWFNLTETEITEFNTETKGGLEGMIKLISETNDEEKIMKTFKKLILMSYGERSADGKYFKKRDSVRGSYADEFEQSAAFNELFITLATNAEEAARFVNGIIPTRMKENNTENHPALNK
jgi:hypothetical protein